MAKFEYQIAAQTELLLLPGVPGIPGRPTSPWKQTQNKKNKKVTDRAKKLDELWLKFCFTQLTPCPRCPLIPCSP